MMQSKVIKTASPTTFEDNINTALEQIGDRFIDLKLSSTYNGSSVIYIAVIIYK